MTQTWTGPETHPFRDAYLDWSDLIEERRTTLLPAPNLCPTGGNRYSSG